MPQNASRELVPLTRERFPLSSLIQHPSLYSLYPGPCGCHTPQHASHTVAIGLKSGKQGSAAAPGVMSSHGDDIAHLLHKDSPAAMQVIAWGPRSCRAFFVFPT
jgi:hypothetical protein